MSTTLGYALAGAVFAVAAVTNWAGLAGGNRRLAALAKPVPILALIALAVAGDAGQTPPGRWLLIGLLFCLAGDLLLIGESQSRFLAGLSAFLLGHLAYVAAFVLVGVGETVWGLTGLVAMAGALLATRRVIPRAAEDGGAGLAGAIGAYMAVIGAMVVTAWLTGDWLIGLGATTFMVSDSILAVNKFVRRLRFGDVAVMVTYYLGQLLITVGVLGALG